MKELIEFCQTVRQVEIIEAIIKEGTWAKAAKAIGITERNVAYGVARVRKLAAKRLPSEHDYANKPVPEDFSIKGVSQYITAERKWVKTSADDVKRMEAIRDAMEAMCEDIPRLGPIEPISGTLGHLCNVYTLTDSHVGMLAWHKEGGEDWDLKIAEKVLTRCFGAMILASPKAKTCVVAQLGDFLHYDGLAAVTPTNAHVLDADGRFAKMVQTAIRILRHVIDLALRHHEKVVVLMGEGNHDIASSVWLRAMFRALYENEPRIEVIDSELPYYTFQHGQTMLAWHHGHLSKNDQLPILFASQFPKVWGNTMKRYCHTGHRHHVEEKEHSGMTVIQHPTLAARDAYAARGGWIAERQVTSITYSDKYGQVARNTVTPEMIQ